jgi:hypothetical protein
LTVARLNRTLEQPHLKVANDALSSVIRLSIYTHRAIISHQLLPIALDLLRRAFSAVQTNSGCPDLLTNGLTATYRPSASVRGGPIVFRKWLNLLELKSIAVRHNPAAAGALV